MSTTLLRPAFLEAFGSLVTDDHDYRRTTLAQTLALPPGKKPEDHFPGIVEFLLPPGMGAAALTSVMRMDRDDERLQALVQNFQDWERAHVRQGTGANVEELGEHSASFDMMDDDDGGFGWSSSSSDSWDSGAWSDESDSDEAPAWEFNIVGIGHLIDESLEGLQAFLDWCSTEPQGQHWLARVFVCLYWAYDNAETQVNLYTPNEQ